MCKQSLHNINYWKMGSYLGIGPSAASTLITHDGPVRIGYKPSISGFLKGRTFNDRVDIEYIKSASFLLEHLMMGFRLVLGIDKKHINSIFGIDIETYLQPILNKWKNNITIDEDSIYLSRKGLALLNPFLVDIARYIQNNSFRN